MTKILLVEDDKSLREIYGVRLLAEGYDIISAGDGEEALAMAIKDRPALIVSDVMMPKISGFDMLDILRSTTETKNIKVIMMTALSSEDQRKRGEQLGADRYLVKSQVGIEDVVRAVHEVLADAPTTSATAPSVAAPAPRPNPQPAPPRSPAAPTIPAPAQPMASNPVPAPAVLTSPPTPEQTAVPAPAQVQPQTAQHSDLPQPTAPFSTPRPNSGSPLANRVIQPINSNLDDSSSKVANQMQAELEAPAPAPFTPPAPQPSTASSPTQTSAPQPTPPIAQTSDNPSISTPPPQTQPSPAEQAGIHYEESPAPTSTQPPAA